MTSRTERPSGIAPAQTWRECFLSTRFDGALIALAQLVGRSQNPPANMWNDIVPDALRQACSFLPLKDIPSLARVSHAWNDSITSNPRAVLHPYALDFERTVDPKRACQLYQTGNIIGQAAWQRIGNPGPIPQLSEAIANRLESACRLWSSPYLPDRRVIDTHLLVWIPDKVTKTVDGREEIVNVTLRNLPNLIPGAKYDNISPEALAQHGDDTPAKERWLLIPKEVMRGSTDLNFAQQQDFVVAQGREMPHAVEIAVALFMKQFCSPGTYLLGSRPMRYTRCPETVHLRNREGEPPLPLAVGCFSLTGLCVHPLLPCALCISGVAGSEEVQVLDMNLAPEGYNSGAR